MREMTVLQICHYQVYYCTPVYINDVLPYTQTVNVFVTFDLSLFSLGLLLLIGQNKAFSHSLLGQL
jgi:hypothetical protein